MADEAWQIAECFESIGASHSAFMLELPKFHGGIYIDYSVISCCLEAMRSEADWETGPNGSLSDALLLKRVVRGSLFLLPQVS